MSHKLALSISASILLTVLGGCASSPLPPGCDAPLGEVEDALKSQLSWQDWASESVMPDDAWLGFGITHSAVFQYPLCFDPAFVAGYEKFTGDTANWDSDPNYVRG